MAGTEIYWNSVGGRHTRGRFRFDYAHPQLGGDERSLGFRVFHRLARMTDREVAAVEDEFHRKRRYVEYLVREGVSDFDALFEFLADLRTDEAATVERLTRGQARNVGRNGGADADGRRGTAAADGGESEA
jgi:hypothetical protein